MDELRLLPSVHAVLQQNEWDRGEKGIPVSVIKKWVQEEIDALRLSLINDSYKKERGRDQFLEAVSTSVRKKLEINGAYALSKVVNATGVVLHTNLGRARLSAKATAHVLEAASSYTNLEYSLEQGTRGSRHDIIEKQICDITGCEAAMVVNNNAAAVYMVLSALAKQKEVIVSRGELVEIGGSFRISSIMEESGAYLKEVGTTNRTHLHDYTATINEGTAMLMKVHTSNFKITGFTKAVSSQELLTLKEQNPELIVYEDLGSGSLFPFTRYGIGDEPEIQRSVAAGLDLVSFSGDKLIGGPQAGIIAGKSKWINQLKKHQLARVLRVDKLTLAALEATLLSYHQEDAAREIPVIRDIVRRKEEIRDQAERIKEKLSPMYECHITEGHSMVGGGTMPEVSLPTYIIEATHPDFGAAELSRKLREQPVPVIVTVKHDRCHIDPRTVDEADEAALLSAFLSL
ncbi:L-seryl-tRNA(Sec) selenium transferase [Fictibacillus fluitans]|uniref:L-seryl-tRNA(Sec) selenium transferase n=1 Tax=Fictibacillus fluitans TaxID=3058422 RepID=A0ABT8HR86_9BACL|nr:L-seryl-tRNA(Sec) selenium transferase [Fictibacillus sp. NE201]MDN4523270.1 L-seryl-tRNA(Sec) selenium transferase [Fictibacillus sp. NE201]